jgi:hypothetical protein
MGCFQQVFPFVCGSDTTHETAMCARKKRNHFTAFPDDGRRLGTRPGAPPPKRETQPENEVNGMGSVSSIAIWVFMIVSVIIVVLITSYQKNKDGEPAKKQTQLSLNRNGNNEAISVTLKDGQEMRKIGFTEEAEGYWHYNRDIGNDFFFDLKVSKTDRKDFKIRVLTGDPARAYDFQRILLADALQDTALDVRSNVEGEMKHLQDEGVVHGHKFGDYI